MTSVAESATMPVTTFGVKRTSVWRRFQQLFCRHDYVYQFGPDRVWLVCSTCGHETPGWDVSRKSFVR